MADDIAWSFSGERYRLGYRADGYELWDNQVAYTPIERFPRTDEGWTHAWARYSALEPDASLPPADRGVIRGTFMKYRVAPLDRHGQWRNSGSVEVSPEGITVEGAHVWPLSRRWIVISALLLLDVVLLITSGIWLFGEIAMYLLVEYVTLTKERRSYPWSQVRSYAADQKRSAVAIDVVDDKYRTPFVLRSTYQAELLRLLHANAPERDGAGGGRPAGATTDDSLSTSR